MRPRSLMIFAVGVLVSAVVLPSSAHAQIMLSEPASVMQQIDGNRITVEYYRPHARARDPLFGQEAVVWEHIWTPGANWATRLSFDKPITIDGVEVQPGTWAIWMQMSEDEFVPETLILDPEPIRFHTDPPEESAEQVRMPMELEDSDVFVEALTWNFEEVRSDGATLAMRWGNHVARFDVGVEASIRVLATAEEATPVVGMYRVELGEAMTPPPGVEIPADMPPPTIEISWEESTGWLKADLEGFPGGPFMNMVDLRLMPFADGIFMPTEYWGDGVLNAWEVFVEMEYDAAGHVTGFLMRDGVTDEVMLEGARTAG